MKPNAKQTKRLRAIKRAILDEPELYNQNVNPIRKYCGTPCCIAGWAVWLENPDPLAYNTRMQSEESGVTMLARSVGLNHEDAAKLFVLWPNPDSPAWRQPMTRAAARDAATRIEHFIATGE